MALIFTLFVKLYDGTVRSADKVKFDDETGRVLLITRGTVSDEYITPQMVDHIYCDFIPPMPRGHR